MRIVFKWKTGYIIYFYYEGAHYVAPKTYQP